LHHRVIGSFAHKFEVFFGWTVEFVEFMGGQGGFESRIGGPFDGGHLAAFYAGVAGKSAAARSAAAS
jgi:hypothetical protein